MSPSPGTNCSSPLWPEQVTDRTSPSLPELAAPSCSCVLLCLPPALSRLTSMLLCVREETSVAS